MKTNHKLALTVLTGISIGLIAGEAIHAQQVKTPPAYIFAEVEKDPNKPDDPAAMKKYAELVPKTVAAFGGQILVASPSNKVQTLEGEATKGFITVLTFASVEKARAWYKSPPYEELKPLRENTRKSRVLLVEGVRHP
jgi:uncharacterized protein (DUF1330 family)